MTTSTPRYIVLVRHGEYDERGLTHLGIAQAKRLAQDVDKRTADLGRIRVLSSKEPRAVQMAEIMADALDQPQSPEQDHEFNDVGEIDLATQFILEHADAADTLIVSSHYGITTSLIAPVIEAFGGTAPDPEIRRMLPKGSAFLIHLETNTVEQLGPYSVRRML